MELDFNSVNEKYEQFEETYNELMERTFSHLSITCNAIVSVSIVDNTFIHEMNRDYRHIDRPTDVISFAFLDGDTDKDKKLHSKENVILGDIYISYEKAEEQAKEYGHSINREMSFLYVHGLLQLLGYDHMNEEDEKIMFKLQDEILG